MVQLSIDNGFVPNATLLPALDESLLKGKRHLTEDEIGVLSRANVNADPSWQNVWGDEEAFVRR